MSSPYEPPKTEVGVEAAPVVSADEFLPAAKVPASVRIVRVLMILSAIARLLLLVLEPAARTAFAIVDAMGCLFAAGALVVDPRQRVTHFFVSIVLGWNVVHSAFRSWELARITTESSVGPALATWLVLWLFTCYAFGRPSRRYAGYAV